MKIKKLHIKNFKSIADLEIIEPSPFTVFVGPNGAGKSNIFEALEYLYYSSRVAGGKVSELFGGKESFLPLNYISSSLLKYEWSNSIEFADFISGFTENYSPPKNIVNKNNPSLEILGISVSTNLLKSFDPSNPNSYENSENYRQFIDSFSRVFVKNKDVEKFEIKDSSVLSLSASNLEKVLRRIFLSEHKREEIVEWLQLFIPEFENIEFETSEFSGEVQFRIFEKHSKKPFPKHLISDGTYHILALLTAVYQSDEPQFLCIEEPENGLTPSVIKEMVTLFRNACEEKGHYIWLNTHSQSLVSQLTADELITVNKVNGETQIKQFKGKDFHGLSMDEAWLTNSLGGGLPW